MKLIIWNGGNKAVAVGAIAGAALTMLWHYAPHIGVLMGGVFGGWGGGLGGGSFVALQGSSTTAQTGYSNISGTATAGAVVTNAAGSLLPTSFATVNLPATCTEGTIVWDTTANAAKSCHSNTWSSMGGGTTISPTTAGGAVYGTGSAAAATAAGITGQVVTSGGAGALTMNHPSDWAIGFTDSTINGVLPGMTPHCAYRAISSTTWLYNGLLADTFTGAGGIAAASNNRPGVRYTGTAAANEIRGMTKSASSLDARASLGARFRFTGGIAIDETAGVLANQDTWVAVTSATLSGGTVHAPPVGSVAFATTQYVGIGYASGVNSGKFVCAAGNATNESGTDTGVTAAAGYWAFDLDCGNWSAGTPSCRCGIVQSALNPVMTYVTTPSATFPAGSSTSGFDIFSESVNANTGDIMIYDFCLWN